MGSDVRELQEVMMDVSYVEWIYVIILRVGMGIWVYGVAAIRLFFGRGMPSNLHYALRTVG